ncbi:MAG TPA: TetR/AcrR family transcriptional regulator [Panacibacter sp.]|nr:TetR/AcrR family transcriptional regulator [Panacibacter sp.]HNP46690.1 TetR/AcrR family transcriptional regulator [Panacibacter sp.]
MVKVKIDERAEQRILAAAKKIFLSKGLDGARMQDIADEAGINKALLHYYFRSKDKLFETIFMEVAKHFLPRVSEIFESGKPLFDKIELFCETYIQQMKETPYLPLFILGEATRRPETFVKKVFGNRKPPVHLFVAQVQQEIKSGNIKPVHPLQLLIDILSMCVFPFMARPMLEHVAGINKKQFDAFIEERKKLVPEMIIASLKNN